MDEQEVKKKCILKTQKAPDPNDISNSMHREYKEQLADMTKIDCEFIRRWLSATQL